MLHSSVVYSLLFFLPFPFCRPGEISRVVPNEHLQQYVVLIARLWLLFGLGLAVKFQKSQKAVQSSLVRLESRRAAGTAGIRGFSTQMSCDLSYSRGKWKADDSIQATVHPYPLRSLWRTANLQLPEISIPVPCLVLFSPAAHQISESACAFKWCPLELS